MTTSLLLGPTAGWSLEPVADWLFGEGRRVDDADRLVEQLAQQLDAAGARMVGAPGLGLVAAAAAH